MPYYTWLATYYMPCSGTIVTDLRINLYKNEELLRETNTVKLYAQQHQKEEKSRQRQPARDRMFLRN